MAHRRQERHPHLDCTGTLALGTTAIIENHTELAAARVALPCPDLETDTMAAT